MFWVLCCKCFIRPFHPGQRKFYMSTCGHIYCELCANLSTRPFCSRCCLIIKLIACDSQMPAEVRSVFCDIGDKAAQLVKALDYQTGQRSGLMSHLRASDQRYNSAKLYIKEAEIKYANLQLKLDTSLQKIKELQMAVESTKKQFHKISQQPPSASPTSDSWFTNFNQSTLPRQSAIRTPTAQFTPQNCYSHHRGNSSAKTPTSYASSKSSISDAGSSHRTFTGFASPQSTTGSSTLNKMKNFFLMD